MRQLAEVVPLTLAAGVLIGAAAAVFRLVSRRQPSPDARERRRRLEVNANGRMVDATIVDLHGNEVHYSYTVRGVQYAATQDISAFRDCWPPANTAALAGHATVKYSPDNPANSIVISEEWSGLRNTPATPPEPDDGERNLP